ncbi:hypothetical protein BN1708_018766 [Verticillium longisporum]|uniref:Uncharacterized protein n=1 Tax=Verticillium longisporum TaxID=100787 RepID=A0A0G4MB96_VERLO|nr:hypothetical protein BN1708_018766 [Verticillium longisporum]
MASASPSRTSQPACVAFCPPSSCTGLGSPCTMPSSIPRRAPRCPYRAAPFVVCARSCAASLSCATILASRRTRSISSPPKPHALPKTRLSSWPLSSRKPASTLSFSRRKTRATLAPSGSPAASSPWMASSWTSVAAAPRSPGSSAARETSVSAPGAASVFPTAPPL